jgi:hypothetical protein
MRRLVMFALAAGAAAPAAASNYMASPVKPAEAQRIIHKGTLWNCGPDACQAATDESRPAVLCQGLAKKVGRLQNFVADGRRFNASELERCNLSAKE